MSGFIYKITKLKQRRPLSNVAITHLRMTLLSCLLQWECALVSSAVGRCCGGHEAQRDANTAAMSNCSDGTRIVVVQADVQIQHLGHTAQSDIITVDAVILVPQSDTTNVLGPLFGMGLRSQPQVRRVLDTQNRRPATH